MKHVLSSEGIREIQALLRKHKIQSCMMFYEGIQTEETEGKLECSFMIMAGDVEVDGDKTSDLLHSYALSVCYRVLGPEKTQIIIDNDSKFKFGAPEFIIDNEN